MTKPAEYIRRPSRPDMKECKCIKDIAEHIKRKLMTKSHGYGFIEQKQGRHTVAGRQR